MDILLRPRYFYSQIGKQQMKDQPFTFLIISSWIFSTFTSIFLFISLFLPTLKVLITGIQPIKMWIIIPLFVFFCSVFFVMITLILGPVILMVNFAISSAVAFTLDIIAKKFSKVSNFNEILKASFYNSAVLIFYSIIPLLLIIGIYRSIPLENIHIGVSFLLMLGLIYLWGLWSISIRKIYKISRRKSLFAAFLLFAIVVLFYMVIGQKILFIIERRLI